MSVYKRVDGPRGTRFLKDRRFISKADISEEILNRLEVEGEVDEGVAPPEASKSCLFCAQPHCKYTRMVSGHTIYLCEEHYYSETIGKIAQKLRERELAHA